MRIRGVGFPCAWGTSGYWVVSMHQAQTSEGFQFRRGACTLLHWRTYAVLSKDDFLSPLTKVIEKF